MFLRCTNGKKDGKEHRYWSVVENRRVVGGRVVQQQVLYLGEINGSQCEAWCRTVEIFEDGSSSVTTMALFPEDCPYEIDDEQVVLDRFWAEKLPLGRKGTRWDLIAQAPCCYSSGGRF